MLKVRHQNRPMHRPGIRLMFGYLTIDLSKSTPVAAFGASGTDLNPFPYALIIPQDEHERLLIERLAEVGVEVERRTARYTLAWTRPISSPFFVEGRGSRAPHRTVLEEVEQRHENLL